MQASPANAFRSSVETDIMSTRVCMLCDQRTPMVRMSIEFTTTMKPNTILKYG